MTDTAPYPEGSWKGSGDATRLYPVDRARPLTLKLVSDAGDVTVRLAERNDLLVRSSGDADRPGADGDPPGLHVVADGNEIAIAPWRGQDLFRLEEGDDPGVAGARGGGFGRRLLQSLARWTNQHPVDIEVEIPSGLPSIKLSVATASGNVAVAGVAGELTVRSASGDAEIDGCSGEIRLDTASGTLALRGIAGELRANLASGDLIAERSRLRKVHVRTASGDAVLREVALGPGEHGFDSASGDVELRLLVAPEAEDAIGIAFSSLSGEARIDPPLRRLRSRPSEPAPGTVVRVRTASGDLRATALPADAADALAVAAPTRATAAGASVGDAGGEDIASPSDSGGMDRATGPRDERRFAVLQALERGEIEVDEAMRRLDSLEVGSVG